MRVYALRARDRRKPTAGGRRFLPCHASIPLQAVRAQDGPAQCATTDQTSRRSDRAARTHCVMQCASTVLPTQRLAATQTGKAAAEGHRVKPDQPGYAKLIILWIPAALLVAYWGAGLSARSVGHELPLWLKICWSWYIALMLHVITMGLVGTLWLKVPIERMSFGFGKRGLQTNIAGIPILFGIFPFGGSVKYAGDEPQNEPKLDGWQRSVVELSGCAALLALAVVIMGRHAPFDVLAIWQQVVQGALSPFGHAQVLLRDLGHYLAGLDELSVLAAMSFGIAAINLLPLPLLNGGNAIMYFVNSMLSPVTPRDQEWLFRAGFCAMMFGYGSWFLALLFLAYSSWVRT